MFLSDPNFWSKHKLPFVLGPAPERFKSMWISTLPRGEGIITLTAQSRYSAEEQMYVICKRIVYEVVKINNETFCPVGDEVDYSNLHDVITNKLKKGTGITDILLVTDDNGKYKGITIMSENTDKDKNSYWYISFVCTATGTKGIGSKMIESIQKEADNYPKIQYVFLETIPDARGFYKKKGFVHVIHRTDENEPLCLKNIATPKIYEKNYYYEREDLMVYCPRGPRIPKNKNVAQTSNVSSSSSSSSGVSSLTQQFDMGDLAKVNATFFDDNTVQIQEGTEVVILEGNKSASSLTVKVLYTSYVTDIPKKYLEKYGVMPIPNFNIGDTAIFDAVFEGFEHPIPRGEIVTIVKKNYSNPEKITIRYNGKDYFEYILFLKELKTGGRRTQRLKTNKKRANTRRK
jgi:hypothetical protein